MGLRGYCRPAEYAPQPASLYRNDGDGTFTDVSRSAGIAARASTGLGVVAADFDRDGRVDIYVANDQRPNFLWMNNGDGTFREEALERGCALSGMGFAQAGMGVAVADPEGDGDWDLFVVNLSGEGSTYYRNAGDGNFLDATDEMGLGSADAAVTPGSAPRCSTTTAIRGSTYSSPTARWCRATAWRSSSRARGHRNEYRPLQTRSPAAPRVRLPGAEPPPSRSRGRHLRGRHRAIGPRVLARRGVARRRVRRPRQRRRRRCADRHQRRSSAAVAQRERRRASLVGGAPARRDLEERRRDRRRDHGASRRTCAAATGADRVQLLRRRTIRERTSGSATRPASNRSR